MTINWFIEERLAEDERLAKEASESSGPNWRHALSEDYPGQYSSEIECDHDSFAQVYREQAAAHIAHHDPARVLRQVTALQAVVGRREGEHRDQNGICETCRDYDFHREYNPVPWPCRTARAIAAIWSDHPDYQQEWKP